MAEKEGVLTKVGETRIAGIPVGAAAVGAVTAGLVDGIIGLVKGVAPATPIPDWAVKGIGSFAVIKWGGRLVGSLAAETAGLFLAYDAVQELVDLRGMISGLFSGIALGHKSPWAITGGVTRMVQPEIPPRAAPRTADTIDEYLRRGGA